MPEWKSTTEFPVVYDKIVFLRKFCGSRAHGMDFVTLSIELQMTAIGPVSAGREKAARGRAQSIPAAAP